MVLPKEKTFDGSEARAEMNVSLIKANSHYHSVTLLPLHLYGS